MLYDNLHKALENTDSPMVMQSGSAVSWGGAVWGETGGKGLRGCGETWG